MNNTAKLIGAALAITLLAGCVPTGLYNWGDYEKDLYLYYKDPTKLDEYTEELEKLVTNPAQPDRVPPGMYAEYGYIMYEQGDLEAALEYFTKEMERWPESAAFMTLAIQNLTGGIAPQFDSTEAPESIPDTDAAAAAGDES